ncbi:MAG TPA: hypothetical protein VNL18_12520 [Gemmatimonadales bacterium]|nr:hypothetical protein [Gemmatimonadales bacterium]
MNEPAYEYEEEAQLSFEGVPVTSTRFTIASASNHFTDQHLRPEQAVEFRGRGVVRGIHYQRASDGAWRRVHIIEAIEVELLGKPHAVA